MMMTGVSDTSFRRNFQADEALVARILALTGASYRSNAALVAREIAHNRDIYVMSDEAGELLAFFMVNEERVAGHDGYYLGLSACRHDLKGRGLGTALYRR